MMSETSQPRDAAPTGEELHDVLREYMAVTGRLQQTHEALQREVTRLRDELEHKNRELELRRRLAALGELAAGVAHEVRNPLGAIQLYSGLLRNQVRAHQLEPALALIEKIEAGIQAIDGVVRDTLALAPRDRDIQPCALRTVIDRAHDASLKTLSQRGVRVEIDVAGDASQVRADADGLQRVLVNLLVNAAEASPPDSVITISADMEQPDQVVVRVCDQGTGLAADTLGRVFDPFFTTKDHGTGLGLTIAHRLIEAYGGELRAQNRPEGGAEFTLVLPRVTEGDPGQAQDDTRRSGAA